MISSKFLCWANQTVLGSYNYIHTMTVTISVHIKAGTSNLEDYIVPLTNWGVVDGAYHMQHIGYRLELILRLF